MPFTDVKKPDKYNTRGGAGYRDQLNSLMGNDEAEKVHNKAEERGEPAPGSPDYLKRRDKEGGEDLKRAPRNGR